MIEKEIYSGILSENICLREEINFSIIKHYSAAINNLDFLLIRVYKPIRLIKQCLLIRRPDIGEFRNAFKASTLINIDDEFFIFIKAFHNEHAADIFVKQLSSVISNNTLKERTEYKSDSKYRKRE